MLTSFYKHVLNPSQAINSNARSCKLRVNNKSVWSQEYMGCLCEMQLLTQLLFNCKYFMSFQIKFLNPSKFVKQTKMASKLQKTS
jgi:hypothetical protein